MSNGRCAKFRVTLSCVSCDLPACKKVCGFSRHTAKHGCHKCMKTFESISFGQTDYSGFDNNNWPLGSGQQHRLACNFIQKEKIQTGMRLKEAETGCRYSPVRNTVIDLMHNLYLGTGKYIIKLWIDNGLIGKEELPSIESRCNLFTVPNSVGRLLTNYIL